MSDSITPQNEPTFSPGDRVLVRLPGKPKIHSGTIITVMPRNDGCERVRFDGKKDPHTIHRDYLSHEIGADLLTESSTQPSDDRAERYRRALLDILHTSVSYPHPMNDECYKGFHAALDIARKALSE